MKRKLFVLLLCCLMIMSSVLVGCKKSDNGDVNKTDDNKKTESKDTESKDTNSKSSDTKNEKTTITWLHHFQEAGIQEWLNTVVKTFTEANPDVEVLVEVAGADNYSQLLKTKIASDDAPMIFDLSNIREYQNYVEADHLYDIGGFDCIADIEPAMLPAGQYNGVQYGIPIDQTAFCVTYNEEIFNELNLQVPTTISEMHDVCQKLIDNGYDPFNASMAEQWCMNINYNVILSPYCLMDDKQWYVDKMNLTSNFSDDENFKKAFETFAGLKPYWGNDPFGTTWDAEQNALAAKKSAMVVNGSWTVDGVMGKNPDMSLRIFAMPSSEDPKDATMVMNAGSQLVVYNSSDSDKLDAAERLYNHIHSQESGKLFADLAFRMSTVKGVDLTGSAAMNDIGVYPDDQVYMSMGVETFTGEYATLFLDTVQGHLMESTFDVDAMAKALDKAFSAIQ